MTEWFGMALDIVLSILVGIGIVQAMKLIRQLRDLKAGRVEMERFVREFNGAVMRAEAGIKALRSAARESGDDLEKLVEKAVLVRDELNFIVESADSVAERLSSTAAAVLHNSERVNNARKDEAPRAASAASEARPQQQPGAAPQSQPAKSDAPPPSRAEKELLQALQKLK